VDRDAVSYALRKLQIQPVGRAGLIRIYPDNALDEVDEFINAKKSRKEPCHAKF